jgi:perosamine synthetase
MLVHIYGLCADLAPILSWAAASGLTVIEDASQGLGLEHGGRPCGSFGAISIASLYANKLVTTGEGGMVLCDEDHLANRCRSLRNLCFGPQRFVHQELGWNYRITAMQAALGVSQLARWDRLVETKRSIGQRYRAALGGIPSFAVAPDALPHARNVWWVFGLVTRKDAGFTREDVTRHLAEHGIGSRPFFWGMHEQPALAGRITAVQLPFTEALARTGFYLPSGVGLSKEDQQHVIGAILSFVDGHS